MFKMFQQVLNSSYPHLTFTWEAFFKLKHTYNSLEDLAGNTDSDPVGLDGTTWFKQGTIPSNREAWQEGFMKKMALH